MPVMELSRMMTVEFVWLWRCKPDIRAAGEGIKGYVHSDELSMAWGLFDNMD